MGSEIFNLKSMYLEDTVVRGARVGIKNARTTRTIEINPGDEPVVKTGETGIDKEYLIQSSLIGNDLNGYGTFTNNSPIVTGYTGAQYLLKNDKIKLDSDQNSYTIDKIEGDKIYLTDRYSKEDQSYPDVQTGSCSVRKIKLDSVKYEQYDQNITYNKDKSEWGITGIKMSDPVIASSDVFTLDTGVNAKFMSGTSKKSPDITTVLSVYKTLVNNNTSPISDVSLSPIPYPHSSLQVFIYKNGEKPSKAVEGVDYVVNYSDAPEIKYPIPPYEERNVAYLKFLGKMTDEVQIDSIGSDFSGYMTLNKKVQEGETLITKPVLDIIPTDEFSIKVNNTEKIRNMDYVSNTDAGLITFVKHINSERLIDTITYPKKLLWDGISVIKGVRENEVNDPDNLVIPGVSGIKGLNYTIYFEDTDANNLIRGTDFTIDPESGAFSLTTPTKADEAVLLSYYVEGEDITNEKVELDTMRLNSFPLIPSSLTLAKKYRVVSDDGTEITKTKVLIEGIDFKASYVTGYIRLLSSSEVTVELRASYTPMAQMNCVVKNISGDKINYWYTIIDDVLTFSQDNIGSKRLIFKVENPVISVPKKILFESDKTEGNYNFSGSILPENIIEIKTKNSSKIFNVENSKYDDIKKEITLDSSVNENTAQDGDIIVGTYGFQSDVIPYAPVLLIYTIINAGDTSFLIEGYDKTDILKAGVIIRVDNNDPQSTSYFVIQSVKLLPEGTNVTIYGSFPETAIDPVFSIFDDQIVWESLSDDVVVDTSVPIGSEQINLNGGGLFIRTNIKTGSLLIVNNQDIYNIVSVTVQDNISTIGIYPKLRNVLTSNVKFSRLPVYDEGITTLPSEKLILTDPAQPAFTLWYNNPEGFEGSAKILFVKEKIVLEEYVSGVKNPSTYEFSINDYFDVYSLAKAIQATKSTFNVNVPDMGVPDYNPFTIAHNNKEDYYLSTGSWSPVTLIPFEDKFSIYLPYTFTVIPELFKWSLMDLSEGSREFVIAGVDETSFFSPGMILAFINKISGRYFFTSVVKAEYDSSTGTVVKISNVISESMIGPYMFMQQGVTWIDFNKNIMDIDYDNSVITFNGEITQNVRVGTLLNIGNGDIYQITEIYEELDYFNVKVNPVLSDEVKIQTYSGYVKISSTPVLLSDPGVQPYVRFTYTVPKTHTGVAFIKISDHDVTIKEILDNFNEKETVYDFFEYENFGDLFDAIKNTTSYDGISHPFNVIYNDIFKYIINDDFSNFRLSITDELYVAIPCYASVAVRSFSIGYSMPVEYTGTVQIKITDNSISLKEEVVDGSLNRYEKETVIYYSSTNNLYDLINNYIPGISSAVSGLIYPFSTEAYNEQVFGIGLWDVTHLSKVSSDYVPLSEYVYATVDMNTFIPIEGINTKRMEIDKDYTIDNGQINLVTPIKSLDRFSLNYMGLDNLVENEEESITCSCRFLTSLPVGYRLDVYLEYINIDQFYIQKLTERKFFEIVTVPQIEEITNQKGSGGGQGNDSGATNSSVANYFGGIGDIYYALQDEYIKKQLYLRFFKWYKQRLRGLSAELQLGLGFKFGHSNAVGKVGEYYSLDDAYVETEDYTLTKDSDIDQIDNGFSKYFPVGYNGQAPDQYHRFGIEYLSFNEVYCCNITYRNEKNDIVTVGIIKSDKPYWNRTSDLVFKVWDSAYINKNLVGCYSVDVPQADREFYPSNYTFLRIIDTGYKIRIDKMKKTYTISEIQAPDGKTYEYIRISNVFTDKGIRTYNIVDKDISFSDFVDNLPPDGYRIWIKRQSAEEFPMFDDYGSLGATAYGDVIDGLIPNTRRIKKPAFAELSKFLFPLPIDTEPVKKFKILVKKDSEGSWETVGSIDLSKLTFKEERNVDDVLDGLRYDFTEKFTVPSVPPVTVYDIKEYIDKGFHQYFYLSLEKIYDADQENGYYDGIVLRCKNRNWWFMIVDDGDTPVIDDYGFRASKIYENFYDPDNIYKKLLIEKQAWETEELIIRDLYDHSDKIARAFDHGDLNRKNSKYQYYLARPYGGTVDGISDILRVRIPAYEKQLRFLTDVNGPVYRTLYPDLVHAEDSASPDIALTYSQTLFAWNLYNTFYAKMWFYYTLNEDNNNIWKNDYIKWVLSLERGIIYQKLAKQMYEEKAGILTIGIQEIPTIRISYYPQLKYTLSNTVIGVYSNYEGKYLRINFNATDSLNQTVNESLIVFFYTKSDLTGVPTIVYKTISEICSEISNYRYGGVTVFTAENIFTHYENNVTSKICYVTDQPVDPSTGYQLVSTNVADHRDSDSRILFLNKNIEDRVYTHGIRELPGFNLSYLGNYYLLKYGAPGISVIGTSYPNFKYGIFLDEEGKKVLTVAYGYGDSDLEYVTYRLYTKTVSGTNITYTYKTLSEISSEIYYDGKFSSQVLYNNPALSCENFIVTSGYVTPDNKVATPYISTDSRYESIPTTVDQFYYRIYNNSIDNKKLDIVFYDLVIDGSDIIKGETISDIFSFDFIKSDNTYKTLDELCSEISDTLYKGESIFSAASVYEQKPNGGLFTSFVVPVDNLLPVGYDLEVTIYVDTYVEAISGNHANDRSISSIKNAVFSFPMYTANGNPNKIAIEDIPVSGKWETLENEPVMEVSCIDGKSWETTFSDYDSGDYKSYMAHQDIVDLIDQGETLTEEQYQSIRVVEDRPSVAVLKELVLTRKSGTEKNVARFSLRKYSTINELIQAIVLARFNDSGDVDSNGNRCFFSAKLIGTPEVQGAYKSYELDAVYTPVVKSFTVLMNDGSIEYKSNQLIGWKIQKKELDGTLKDIMRMSQKRYSQGQTYKFVANGPQQSYNETLNKNPQGFRRNILAFDIYSWDYNAHYEIRNNWIYFKSDSVDYIYSGDMGQPDKTLGYGIPLSGSGHPLAPDRESLSSLINRINSNTVVNKWFYANLKFTRDNKNDPGYFEYNYLPNFYANIPKSNLDSIKLKDDYVMSVSPGTGYTFTNSNITVDDVNDTIDLSCDWNFDYVFENTFFFNEVGNSTVGDLASSINSALPPQIASSVVEATAVLPAAMSSALIPTFVTRDLTLSDTDLMIHVGVSNVTALKIKIRTIVGPTIYTINRVTFVIPRTRDRIKFKYYLTYHDSYSLTGYDISSQIIGDTSDFISSIKPYPDEIFNSLFGADTLSDVYRSYDAKRLMSISDSINVSGTRLPAHLNDITAFQVLNMASVGSINVSSSMIEVTTNKTYTFELTLDNDIHKLVENITGDYNDGFISCDVLPIKISSVTTGGLDAKSYTLQTGNTPTHVYFGIMGDIKFVQISDYNLHMQYNYIKERLGMPWRDEHGNLEYDYYTPETFNENNPCAIDLNNFLGYLRTGRYNQIKNSMVNEAIVSNKYFWLYMKLHREFGCDQRAKMLKGAIQKGDFDLNTLGQIT